MLKLQLQTQVPNQSQANMAVSPLDNVQSSTPQVPPMPDTSGFSGNKFCLAISDVENKWIINTTATNHMVCSINHLTTITDVINANVKLPNGGALLVTHIETMKLSETLSLTNVLCIPSFRYNLISAGKLIFSNHCA